PSGTGCCPRSPTPSGATPHPRSPAPHGWPAPTPTSSTPSPRRRGRAAPTRPLPSSVSTSQRSPPSTRRCAPGCCAGRRSRPVRRPATCWPSTSTPCRRSSSTGTGRARSTSRVGSSPAGSVAGLCSPCRASDGAGPARREQGGGDSVVDASVMGNDLEKVLYTEEQIQTRLAEMAQQIDADYAGREVLLVGVLNGAVMVMADLS